MPSSEPAGPTDEARLTAASPAAAMLLPHVVRDAPAAVLLIDLDTAEVAYASKVATQLAPELTLPFSLAEWTVASGLQSASDSAQHPTDQVLHQLAAGALPTGRAMTARLSTDMSSRRELLWATGVPLYDAPGLSAMALLVFLPLSNVEAIESARSAMETEAMVRDRAVLATGLSFTVADARREGQPLIWINPAFTAATGYAYDDAVGRNCRFLQGPDTDPRAHEQIRTAVDAGEALVITLLNYRKDGSPFWNQLALNPIHDAAGELTHYVGIQTDVTEQRQAEVERERALDSERQARQVAEEAQAAAERANAEAQESRARLQLLAEASTVLSGSLNVGDTFDRLIRLVVPRLADWVVVEILGGEMGLDRKVIVRHRDGLPEACRRMEELTAAGGLSELSMSRQVIATGRPQLRSRYDPASLEASAPDSELRELLGQLQTHSGLAVPLRARTRLLGVMTFLCGPSGREYDDDDLRVVADLGRRAAMSLDNARLYSIEHDTAETLQRSLLPDLPDLPDLDVAVRYLAGHTTAAVGGDFYELLALPDGAIGVAIGDVVGHDMTAAAAMGHLRGLLRACAWDESTDDFGSGAGSSGKPSDSASPTSGAGAGRVMARVDRLVQGLHVAPLATVFYGRLERTGGTGWELHWANAGHPPPLILRPDGGVQALDTDVGVLLGVQLGERDTVVTTIESGSILFCYTDGLIERRDADIDAGIRWLSSVLAGAPADVTPSQLCELALTGLESVDDDIAILAVRLA